jgi:hypothetical protein
MDRPVFTSIQPPGVAHADAVSAGEAACAPDRPMAAPTRDADKATIRSRELQSAPGAESSEARWSEPVVCLMFHVSCFMSHVSFLMFHFSCFTRNPATMDNGAATAFLCSKHAPSGPYEQPSGQRLKQIVSVSANGHVYDGTTAMPLVPPGVARDIKARKVSRPCCRRASHHRSVALSEWIGVSD